ncbi:hypothetical protein IFM89_007792 [Coptis chinensis]|uniref:Amino acid transporter transmembrane domain-containing protein n=1 Tax=Coptis chinensis TaxID=261450 RepID=A0A835IUV0_9MAGN|nr:hypothetical protein IFM89_007792 [Coptis chinensis]
MEMHNRTSVINQNPEITEHGLDGDIFDDDGRVKRTGTLLTASAHIITAVIGSGVLSLAWALAQLGWIAGPIALMTFALITLFTSMLLADCYRSPDPLTGKRNYTYSDAVGANLVAAIMSFAYAIIGLGLAASKLAGGSDARTTLTGVTIGVDVSQAKKVYRVFQSLGNIASAYFYSTVLIEIQASELHHRISLHSQTFL